MGGGLPYVTGSDGPECDVKTNEARGRHFTRHFSPQIREQMSGPDIHVFTLKFLALKKQFFSLFRCQKFFCKTGIMQLFSADAIVFSKKILNIF